MKKILIIASDMEIGGAERALLGLLGAIDYSSYHIDLFLLHHQGPFMELIPEKVNLLPEMKGYSDLSVPLIDLIKKGHFNMALGRLRGKEKAKSYIKKNHLSSMNSVEIHYSFKYTMDFLPIISNNEYDLALSFTIPYYVLDQKVNAKNKAVWIHTDYTKLEGDREEELKVWSAYNNIVSISDSVTKSFIQVYPTLEAKITKIENIVSEELIVKQSEMFSVESEMPEQAGIINILSVGRFTDAKNFDNIPRITSILRKNGTAVRWYIIGFGKDEALIRSKIHEYHVEEEVIILGKKDNPYPYIKACDIYIQPSRFEGKAVTVQEAQILHKPVIITNFPTAKSQLIDGYDGVIVSQNVEECAAKINKVINNKSLLDALHSNCLKSSYGNEKEVEKIYQLMKE